MFQFPILFVTRPDNSPHPRRVGVLTAFLLDTAEKKHYNTRKYESSSHRH